MNIVFIDMSYFIFYRYYALLQWWKLANPEIELDNPINNLEFVEKFKKTFIQKLQEINKKLKLKNSTIIACKDCPRNNIWRNNYYNKYKEHRVNDDTFMGGPFFKLAYNELINDNVDYIFDLDTLEGDDCLAISVKYLNKKYDNLNIYIIANDMDYLQLLDKNIKLYNLKYKDLQTSKNSNNDPKCDLFCKIVMGDKSDNIDGIFKKCGIKTALKYYNDKELFLKMLNKEQVIEKYELNKKIIDFDEIPKELVNKFIEKYNNILNNVTKES